jgi:hypothetical protein
MTCLRMSACRSSLLTLSACWLEMTTASMRAGLPVLVVLDRDLALAVGAQVGQLAGLAHLGELAGELVGQRDGRGHQLGGLVGGVAEHHALVAGAAGVNALGDVAGLLVDGGDDGAGVGVEAVERVVVADGGDDAAHQALEIDVGLGGDFAGDDHQAGAVRVSRRRGCRGPAPGRRPEWRQRPGRQSCPGWPSVTDSEVKRNKYFLRGNCHARWGGRIRWDCWFYGTRPRSAGQRVPAEGEPRWLNSKMRGLERVSDGGRSRPASRESRPRGVESGQRILMSEKTPQNLSNHVRTDWWFMVLGLIVTINLIVAIVSLVHVRNFHHVWVLILSLALIILWLRVRGYPLKVQDRVIRLEERLRLQAACAAGVAGADPPAERGSADWIAVCGGR